MTRHFGPDDHDQAAQHWLTRHQHALTHALDDLLDTEAGLREILLHSHHDTAMDNLDTVLDTEAGLAAILPGPQTPPVDAYDATPHDTGTAELLHALSPADRMTLRNDRDVRTASRALDCDRGIVQDRARGFVGDRALGLARDRALELAFDLHRALQIGLARDRDRAQELFRARDLDRASNYTRASAGNLVRILDRVLARDFSNDLSRAITAQELVSARELDRAVERVIGLEIELRGALGLARILDLGLALACALNRAHALGRALGLARTRDPDLDRTHAHIVELRTAEVGRAIGLALQREPLVLDKDSLHALLDDFTATDLSNTDLTGIDLSGVRWSEYTTRWPSAIDVEDLKARSDETPPGSGTWIVRSGTATIRDHAER
ncbi:hypothetical protein [Streptomyces prunicolor]|uniref:hypothetical protein n=1 Tax=Streptomyces prunicolor TaxID=67348 RepID=UPI00342CBD93